MTVHLLADLTTAGIILRPDGDMLTLNARRNALTPELLARVKKHKAELMRLLAEPLPILDLQPNDDDWHNFTTPDRQGFEHPNAPPRAEWGERPTQFRRLVGNGFQSFPHERMDPRIIANRVAKCPTCNAARVLPELRKLTGGLCWNCHERKQ